MSSSIDVSTEAGLVRGTRVGEIADFLGIPFAKAARFAPPEPPEPWEGIRDCTTFGPVCPQVPAPAPFDLLMRTGPADEGCLNLNIWAPGGARNAPVLVWLHGGGFLSGSGSDPMYDGRRLAADGVIVVAINYRHGPFGFLHADSDWGRAGNRGIEDQLAALRWVQDNIGSFGGDRERVTAGGVSAGAMSVAALLSTPAAGSLFRRAILQSGAGHHALPEQVAVRVADTIAATIKTNTGDELASAPAGALVAAVQALFDDRASLPALLGDSAAVGLPVAPVIEGRLLSQRPIDALKEEPPVGVDVLIGTNAEEWRLFPAVAPDLADPPREMVKAMLTAHLGDRADAALELYASARPEAPLVDLLSAAETDRIYRVPAVRLADVLVARNNVFVYRFCWPTPALGGRVGACHAVEVPFVFGTQADPACVGLTGPDAPNELSENVRAAWARFISEGAPGHVGGAAWPTWDAHRRPTMEIDLSSAVVEDPCGAEVDLWAHI